MTRLLLVAAVALVVVLAAAGVGAGAEWDVYPGAGTPIQTAIDGAGAGDMIYVHAGTYVENVDVDKRVTLIGDGADVVTGATV
jgi:nitrous oxidase accessory protein NosD